MIKKIKSYFKVLFKKKLVKEQKVLKIVLKAHRKEQILLNKLLEENCDNEYISNKINELMKDEIREGINKLFPNQKVIFDVPSFDMEEQDEKKQDVSKIIAESNNNLIKQSNFGEKIKNFFKKFKRNSSNGIVNQINYGNLLEYNGNNSEQNYQTDFQKEISENVFFSDYKKDDYKKVENFNSDYSENVDEYEDFENENQEYWLINALSGYKNDRNRISNYTTSLCLVKNNEICFSAVFDWYRKDVYYAVKGKGAYMNYRKIRVSQTKTMDDSIIAFRIGSRGLNDNMELQKALTPMTLTMQSFSNVAIEMCFVASGKIDGCVDVAVADLLSYKIGKLILEEAGGKVSDFSGKEFKNSNTILATNGMIHDSILRVVKSKLVSSSIKKAWKITRTALKIVTAII